MRRPTCSVVLQRMRTDRRRELMLTVDSCCGVDEESLFRRPLDDEVFAISRSEQTATSHKHASSRVFYQLHRHSVSSYVHDIPELPSIIYVN
jgi:hypothetical protein